MVSFLQEGMVSLWVFRKRLNPASTGGDVLGNLCGVDYYNTDFQDMATSEDVQPLASLLSQISDANSFLDEAVVAAERIGVKEAYGVIAQFDFAYEPSKVTRP